MHRNPTPYARLCLFLTLISVIVLSNISAMSYASGAVMPCTGNVIAGTNIVCADLSISNTIIDVGQSTTFTFNGISGGIGPYGTNTLFEHV